jgi:alkanesulfonate monooxygenase SsuD/methylene tetrahydromethanopterin reductase-like flavin-dependent oxidoreductase (luciferase family)
MTRLGYQIPNLTYPGVGPEALFDVFAQQAREADSSGFDTVLVMDHFYQFSMLGSPDQ